MMKLDHATILRRHAELFADAAAKHEDFSTTERDAYFCAVLAAPAVYDDGSPVPVHDIGMAAARPTGTSS